MYLFLTNSTYQSFVFGRTYVQLCVVVLSCTDQPVLDMYLQCGCPILHCLYSTYLPLLLYYPTQTSLYLTLPAAAVVLPCTDQPVLDLTCCYCSIILHRPACTWTYLHLCLYLKLPSPVVVLHCTDHPVLDRTYSCGRTYYPPQTVFLQRTCRCGCTVLHGPARKKAKEKTSNKGILHFMILHKNVYLCM